MLKRLETISSKIEYINKYWEYRLDLYSRPDGLPAEYHYVHTLGSTFVIPRHSDGRLVLIRQYRYLNQRESLEFPGGGLKSGLTHPENGRQELAEEAGLAAASLTYIGCFNPYKGVTDEICEVYLATDLSTTRAEPDDSEEIEVVEVSHTEFEQAIGRGEVWDGMSLAAWTLYLHSPHYPKEQ